MVSHQGGLSSGFPNVRTLYHIFWELTSPAWVTASNKLEQVIISRVVFVFFFSLSFFLFFFFKTTPSYDQSWCLQPSVSVELSELMNLMSVTCIANGKKQISVNFTYMWFTSFCKQLHGAFMMSQSAHDNCGTERKLFGSALAMCSSAVLLPQFTFHSGLTCKLWPVSSLIHPCTYRCYRHLRMVASACALEWLPVPLPVESMGPEPLFARNLFGTPSVCVFMDKGTLFY